MKKFWIAAVILVAGAGIYFLEKPKGSGSQNSMATNAVAVENNSVNTAAPENSNRIPATLLVDANTASPAGRATPAAAPTAPATNAVPTLPPLTILDNARVAMHNYNSAFGENPVGTNPEITAALTGNNPKQIQFITAESGLRVNASGELVDAYGTPFFFHQISGHEMEIHSAGPDKKMWTGDDQVTR